MSSTNNGVIVDYRFTENNSHKNNILVASVVSTILLSATFFQLTSVLVNADTNPLSSPLSIPLTSPINSLVGTSNSGENSGSNDNNNSGGSVCNDIVPKTAPYITSVQPISKTQVVIYWTKSEGSVTSYSLSFGIQPGKYIYGVNNISQNTSSVIVSNLSPNTKYYFSLKAINGCNGSAFSNEASTKNSKLANSPKAKKVTIKMTRKTLGKVLKVESFKNPTKDSFFSKFTNLFSNFTSFVRIPNVS